jgi:hypothetical protein
MDRTSNEEIHDFDSLNIAIKVVKSRNTRQASHVVRMGETIEAYRGLVDKLEEKIFSKTYAPTAMKYDILVHVS